MGATQVAPEMPPNQEGTINCPNKACGKPFVVKLPFLDVVNRRFYSSAVATHEEDQLCPSCGACVTPAIAQITGLVYAWVEVKPKKQLVVATQMPSGLII